MRKTLPALLISFFCGLGSLSSESAVFIKAQKSCGKWIADQSSTEAQQASIPFGAKMWVLGYLSGLVMATNVNALDGVDSDSIFLWVDKYCRSNPLKDTADASLDLFLELKKQKGL